MKSFRARLTTSSSLLLLPCNVNAVASVRCRVTNLKGDLQHGVPRVPPAYSLSEKRDMMENRKGRAAKQSAKFTRLTSSSTNLFRGPKDLATDPKAGTRDITGTPLTLVAEARRLAVLPVVREIEAHTRQDRMREAGITIDQISETAAAQATMLPAPLLKLTVDFTDGHAAEQHYDAADHDGLPNNSENVSESLVTMLDSVVIPQPRHRTFVAGSGAAQSDGADDLFGILNDDAPPAPCDESFAATQTTTVPMAVDGPSARVMGSATWSGPMADRCLSRMPPDFAKQKFSAAALLLELDAAMSQAVNERMRLTTAPPLPSSVFGALVAARWASKHVKEAARSHSTAALADAVSQRLDEAADDIQHRLGNASPCTPLDVDLTVALAGLLFHWCLHASTMDVELSRRASSLMTCIAGLALTQGCVVDLAAQHHAAATLCAPTKALVLRCATQHIAVAHADTLRHKDLPRHKRTLLQIAHGWCTRPLTRCLDSCLSAALTLRSARMLETLPMHPTTHRLLSAVEELAVLDATCVQCRLFQSSLSSSSVGGGNVVIAKLSAAPSRLTDLHKLPALSLLDVLLHQRCRAKVSNAIQPLSTLVLLVKTMSVHAAALKKAVAAPNDGRSIHGASSAALEEAEKVPLRSATSLGNLARAASRYSSLQPLAKTDHHERPRISDRELAEIVYGLFGTQCVWSGTRTFVTMCVRHFFHSQRFEKSDGTMMDDASANEVAVNDAHYSELVAAMPLCRLAPRLALKVVTAAAGMGTHVPLPALKAGMVFASRLRAEGVIDAEVRNRFREAFAQLVSRKGNQAWKARLREAKTSVIAANNNSLASSAGGYGQRHGHDMPSPSPLLPAGAMSAAVSAPPTSLRPEAFMMVRLTRSDPFEPWGLEMEEPSLALKLRDTAAAHARNESSGGEKASHLMMTPAAKAFAGARCPHAPPSSAQSSRLDPSRCRLVAVDGAPIATVAGAKRAMFGALSVALHLAVTAAPTAQQQ
jgi:hypothetical protein